MKIFNIIILNVIFMLCNIPSAQAICAGNDQGIGYDVRQVTQTVNFSSVNIQKDVPVGSIIAKVVTPASSTYFGYCTTAYGSPRGSLRFNFTYGTAVKSSIDHVYETNVPGVGIRITYLDSIVIGYFESPAYWIKTTSAGAGLYTDAGTGVSLIKTGPISPGVINGGELGYIDFDGTATSKSLTIKLGGDVPVAATSCLISNKNINVKLDDILGVNLTSVGTVANLKTFDVGLDCDIGANINVKLAGTQNTDTSADGVLQLTNAGKTGVAQGVGVQILYNDTPMKLNQNVLLKTSAGGEEKLTFGVQYYQTKSSVSTGSANATATLEITYQ